MPNPENKERKKVDAYLKYSGMAFQMTGVILVSIFLGKWLDEKMANETPYITILLTLLLFGGYMYKLSKELS